MKPIATVDARGLLCPLPVLRTRKVLSGLSDGDVIAVLTDDPAALIDLPHFCAEAGHGLVGHASAGGHETFTIRKGG
ncbi:sulfurtransferase TusA family protein [Tropicimonas sp.]|uniref:sulfurtransferase TusA family protein n=1 Tax=Tropicimonas sp. TaxID=2067044 RepID=UPI003A83A26E